MSRSYKHTPISSWCTTNAGSQRWFRESENRAKRHRVKQLLTIEQYEKLPDDKEYGNEWASPRDGKMYFGNMLKNHCFHCRWYSQYGECNCSTRLKDYKEYMRK